MVKRLFLPAFILSFISCPALALDFWAGVEKAAVGEPALVFQGMGEDFPKPEEIKPQAYADRYEPVTMVGANGEVKLTKGKRGGSFVSEEPLAAGSYYVLASSVVGFASRTPSSVVRKSKAEEPTATTCSYGGNFGKTLVSLTPAPEPPADAAGEVKAGQPAEAPADPPAGEAKADPPLAAVSGDGFVTKPVGQKLEIVPLVNPAKIKVGEKFPVKVLYDGKPLASATVGAFFAGFTEHNRALAFSAMTDGSGLVEIIPLRPGDWLAKVSKTGPYSDQKVCDRETYATSFAFTISE